MTSMNEGVIVNRNVQIYIFWWIIFNALLYFIDCNTRSKI